MYLIIKDAEAYTNGVDGTCKSAFDKAEEFSETEFEIITQYFESLSGKPGFDHQDELILDKLKGLL